MRKDLFRNLVLLSLAVAVLSLVLWGVLEARRLGIQQGYEPEQPIAFSHKVHAGDHKMECLYCHFGAEQSRHAGIPPANVCLNCHQQIKADSPEIQKIKRAVSENRPIEWVKVHNLPDFVYFNHSQHVISGVSCQNCHGPVEQMTRMRQAKTLTMGWCIECHREQGITPPAGHPDTVPGELEMTQDSKAFVGGMDCAKCHY